MGKSTFRADNLDFLLGSGSMGTVPIESSIERSEDKIQRTLQDLTLAYNLDSEFSDLDRSILHVLLSGKTGDAGKS